jgi:hypothetical protein
MPVSVRRINSSVASARTICSWLRSSNRCPRELELGTAWPAQSQPAEP